MRELNDADDYYRSKIMADHAVLRFLTRHPDMHASLVLPGWMWGPADIGPTSSGQLVNDVVRGKLPGLVPGSFSVVDARDVAQAHLAAALRGQRGERYLAAVQEMYARISGKPILLSLATVRLMVREAGRPFRPPQERAGTRAEVQAA